MTTILIKRYRQKGNIIGDDHGAQNEIAKKNPSKGKLTIQMEGKKGLIIGTCAEEDNGTHWWGEPENPNGYETNINKGNGCGN